MTGQFYVSLSCTANGYNHVTCQLSAEALAAGGDAQVYFFFLRLENGQVINGVDDSSGNYTFTGLENGTYEIWYEDHTGAKSASVFRTGSCVPEPLPPVCDLKISTVAVTHPSAVGVNDGVITVTANTTASGLQLRLTKDGSPLGLWVNATSGTPYAFNNLASGTYKVVARDGNSCTTSDVAVTVAAAAKLGCTDPTATNYDPAATENNGTCTYTPVPVVPFFDVPVMNSLRFVQVMQNPNHRTTFATLDNTLLCDQVLQGVANVGYEQKINQLDKLNIQFRSNYTTHTVQAFDSTTSTLLATFAAAKKVANTNKSLLFTTLLKSHSNGTKTRVYFSDTDFNFDVAPGHVIVISNAGIFNGRYAIESIGQEAAASNPYFVISKPYTPAVEATPCSVYAEYDELPYNVWEVEIDFAAVPQGICYLTIKASDARAEFTQAPVATSEPVSIKAHHQNTCLVRYKNLDSWCDIDYTTGIYHLLRVEGNFFKPLAAGTREIHRNSNGSIVKLWAQKHRKLTFDTYMLPAWLHEKLGVAFDYDTISINGKKIQTEEAYEPDYLNRYSLANGTVEVEEIGFFSNNNNSHDAGDIDTAGGRIIVNDGYLKY